MKRIRIFSLLAAVAMVEMVAAGIARADTTAQTLPFTQNWSDTGLITTDNDWSGVPGIVGYHGDGLTSVNDVDPQTVLSEGSPPVVNVKANQANPNTYTTGGVVEFDGIADPCVAFQGSGTANAPNIVITVNTNTLKDITVAYNLRDIDGSSDNATQQVALQYRVGTTGDFTNVPAGYVADASTGPDLATLVTPVSAVLPAEANSQSIVQIRIITTNASGSDELIGIDDISITGSPGGTPTNATLQAAWAFNGNIVAQFDLDPGSVTAGNFTLTGTQSLGFSSITGTGTQRVLTPSSALTVGDSTQDNLAVAAAGTANAGSVDFYVYPPISLMRNGTIAAGTIVGVKATVTGKQTTPQEGTGQEYSLADAAGADNGIFVEDPANLASVVIDHLVDVAGLVDETYNVTTIHATSFQDLGAGTPIAVTAIAASDFLAANLVDSPPAENYEGVLISISGLTNATDANYGETLFNEGVKLDGLFYDAQSDGTITFGYNYSVTGIGYYSFGEYKILPRQASDLVQGALDDPDILAPTQVTVGHTLNTVAKDKDIIVTNDGASQTLNISGATFSGSGAAKFSVVSGVPAAVTPGNSATIRIRFTPGGVNGLFKANLDIASDDPSNASTPVALTAFANPGPSVLINEFDTENSSAEYLELLNTTSSPIDLSAQGYVLVFLNGSDNKIYQATGLTGTIPANGLYLLTENGVSAVGSASSNQQAAWTSFQNGQDGVALVKGAQESDFASGNLYSTQMSGVSGAWQSDGIIYGGADADLDFELGLSGINIPVQSNMATMRVTDGQGGPNDSYANSDWTTGIGTPADRNSALAARSWTLYE